MSRRIVIGLTPSTVAASTIVRTVAAAVRSAAGIWCPLVKAGMEVDLICLRETVTDPKRETLGGIAVRRVFLRRRRRGPVGYVYQYVTFLLIALGILAVRSLSRRYALVYVHNMPDILVLSAVVPRALGAKVILDLHDPMPRTNDDDLRSRPGEPMGSTAGATGAVEHPAG